MGREVRRVPPNWDHPKTIDDDGQERLQPMYDQTFADAVKEWKEGYAAWEAGDRPFYAAPDAEYWDHEGPPPEDRAMYRPWSDEEATWFQLWQTVSEGTPVSPPFATKEELAQYLAEHGDFWDQKRAMEPDTARLFGIPFGQPGWGYERARAFVNAGWAPSMMVQNTGGSVTVAESKDIPLMLEGH